MLKIYAAGSIYQFVRDEQDRDLLRYLLIRAREDEDSNEETDESAWNEHAATSAKCQRHDVE